MNKTRLKPKTSFAKITTLISHVANWYMIVQDKLWGGKNITYHFRSGSRVECRTKSTDINEALVVLSGIEYPKSLCTFTESHTPVIVLDVGANIGAFSLYLHKLNSAANCHIYAFEPFLGNAELYINNMQHNHISDFQLIDAALSGYDGVARFNTTSSYDAFRIDEFSDSGTEIQTIKLSTFCQTHDIAQVDLLKMDIEGAEFDVIAHDIDFIKAHVHVILMEYHLSDAHPSVDVLVHALADSFTLSTENEHEYGGMILGVNKHPPLNSPALSMPIFKGL